MTTHEISNNDDIIDSRDVIARIEELEDEISDLEERMPELRPEEVNQEPMELADAQEELNALREFADELGIDEVSGRYGGTLIRDSYFEEYAEEFAYDIGAIDRNANWPLNCIDWKQATEELQMDYSSAEWDGVTYWYRE